MNGVSVLLHGIAPRITRVQTRAESTRITTTEIMNTATTAASSLSLKIMRAASPAVVTPGGKTPFASC